MAEGRTGAGVAASEGIQIAYDVQGSGAPLVLIGGLGADRAFWGPLRPLLKGLTTLVLDNRDSGASGSAPCQYGTEAMARDVLAAMSAAGIDRAHILGHSLGGAIAQELALLAPERVDRLIIANSFARNDLYTAELLKLLEDLRRQLDDVHSFLRTLNVLAFSRDTLSAVSLSAISDAELALGPVQPRDNFLRQVAVCRAVDTIGRIGAITARTLILTSGDDRFFDRSHAEAMARAIEGAVIEELPGLGHCPMIEKPAAFAAPVLRFLSP